MANKQPRAILLNPPRSTSTVTMRAMAGYPNAEIYADPYYLCYDAEYNLKQMGKEVDYDGPDEDWFKAGSMIMGQDCTGKLDVSKLKFPTVKKSLENPRQDAALVFCKSIANPLDGNYKYLPDKSAGYRYSILIRDPIKVFVSYKKAVYFAAQQLAAYMKQTIKPYEEFDYLKDGQDKYIFKGYLFQELYDIYEHVKKNLDPDVVIIDSDDVLNDPDGMIRKYCSAMGLPFSESMLKWAGEQEVADDWWCAFTPMYDFQWVRIFFQAALYSKQFNPPSKALTLDEVTDDVRKSVEFVKPIYDKMYALRLK